MSRKAFKSVWNALEGDVGIARNRAIRSELMMKIEQVMQNVGFTRAQAAELMQVGQSRIGDLKRGKIEKFTIDELVIMLTRLGQDVTVEVKSRNG